MRAVCGAIRAGSRQTGAHWYFELLSFGRAPLHLFPPSPDESNLKYQPKSAPIGERGVCAVFGAIWVGSCQTGARWYFELLSVGRAPLHRRCQPLARAAAPGFRDFRIFGENLIQTTSDYYFRLLNFRLLNFRLLFRPLMADFRLQTIFPCSPRFPSVTS